LAGIAALVKPSVLFALIMIAMAISLNGPVIIVARVLGGAAVAVLVTTRTLANVARQIPTMLCWALMPELTRLDAIGAKTAVRRAHSLLVGAYMAISIAFAGALWFDGQSVISFWTRGHLSVEPWLTRAFLLYVLCQAPWMASSMLAGATSRHRKLAWCQLAAGLGGVVLVAVFLPRLGLIAVPLGLLAAEAFACYHFVIADACELAEESYRQFAFRTWSALVSVTALTLAASWVAHHLPIAQVPLRVGIVGVIAATIAAIGVWSVFLSKSDRLFVAGRFGGSIFGRGQQVVS
jgi:O-antigen/teichoic acid export membrane protein